MPCDYNGTPVIYYEIYHGEYEDKIFWVWIILMDTQWFVC